MNNEFYNKDKFSLLSVVTGVVAIPFSSFIIPGIIIGIIAITLGVISRINSEKFNLQNVLGIIFGVIALFLSAVMFLGAVMLLKDPAAMAELTKLMEMYYQ